MAKKKQHSAAVKGLRTALQSLVALAVVALASDDFQAVFVDYYPELGGLIPAVAGLLAFVQNKLNV